MDEVERAIKDGVLDREDVDGMRAARIPESDMLTLLRMTREADALEATMDDLPDDRPDLFEARMREIKQKMAEIRRFRESWDWE